MYEENDTKNPSHPWTDALLSYSLRGQRVQDHVLLKSPRKLSLTSIYKTLPLLRVNLNHYFLSRPFTAEKRHKKISLSCCIYSHKRTARVSVQLLSD